VTLSEALLSAEVFTDGDWVESKDQNPAGDVRLVQMADIGVGQYLDRSDRYLTSETARRLNCTFLKPGDLLVSRMPDPLGRCCIFPGDSKRCVTVVDVCIIRPDPTVLEPRWLMHCLNSPGLQGQMNRFATGTTRARISRKNLGRVSIGLPRIAEQRRIAAILDQADALRAKRSQAMKMLDNLAQATFLDLFGDPVSNDRGWKRIPLANVVSGIASGQSPVCEARPARNGEWAVLKLGAVSYGRFNASENKAFLGDVASIKRVEVQPGDFLFSRKNTKELVGATVVVDDVPPRRLLPDLIFRIDLIDGQIEAQYLHGLLTNPRKRPQVVSLASGSASSMSNISQARLLGLKIEVPPIGLQHEYSARVHQIDRLRARYERDLLELDNLFASLQFRAFSGQL
jgi:type I restriction enzyme S subunit